MLLPRVHWGSHSKDKISSTNIKIRVSCFYPEWGSGGSEVAIGVNYVNKCSRLMAGGKRVSTFIWFFNEARSFPLKIYQDRVWIMSTNVADSWLEAKTCLNSVSTFGRFFSEARSLKIYQDQSVKKCSRPMAGSKNSHTVYQHLADLSVRLDH